MAIYPRDYVDSWFDSPWNSPRKDMESRLAEILEDGAALPDVLTDDLYSSRDVTDVMSQICDEIRSDLEYEVESDVEYKFDRIAEDVIEQARIDAKETEEV